MRIAVDCRFLSLGPDLMSRGIPRYTLQQLQAVVRATPEWQYLFLHRAEDPVAPLGALRDLPNVALHAFPGEASRVGMPERTLESTEVLERWLLAERVDLFHATSPWLPVITVFPRIDACPVITTVYDLIPSLFAEHLVGPMKDGWSVAIEGLYRSTRLLAISRFTARDLTLHLKIPEERIDVASPFAQPCFEPLAPDVLEARMARLRRRTGLPSRYVMTVSFPGFRNKNVETLLAGYRLLPAGLRAEMPLVVVGAQGPAADTLRMHCDAHGITDNVIVTGIVTDDEMAALYCAATLVVCPSRYEGFGLPIVEAMQCGAPVVTTTAACMPEVAGDAAVLVDAEDAGAFADAIQQLAADDARRADMRSAGFARAAHFTSEALGQATKEAYERAVSAGATEKPARSRVAVTLANPARFGADTRAAIEMAEALSRDADVDLFATGPGLPAADLLRRFRFYDISALERLRSDRGYDVVVRTEDREDPVHAVLPGVEDPLGPQPFLQQQQARAQLSLPATAFVVYWPQPATNLAEAQAVLLAFADLLTSCPQAWLFVQGENGGQVPPNIAALGTQFGLGPRIRAEVSAQLGDGLPFSAAVAASDAYLAAADVVLALDASGVMPRPSVLARACAAGKPLVVSQSDTASWAPSGAIVRVPTGPSLALVLAQVLAAFSHDATRTADIGRVARQFFERELTIERMADRLGETLGITRAAPEPVRAPVTHIAPVRESRSSLGFNRVCNLEDFSDAGLVAEIREVMAHKYRRYGDAYPRGVEHCKDWEVAMATRTLRHFGALRPDASILGVAAGMEETIFYLSRHVREVMVVDRYAQAGVWQLNSPIWMLVSPELGAHDGCNPERLVVQHMDARRLRLPPDRFDGIFSSGSIEHFGGLMDVAHAAYEMGRVLKPGGVLSLATVMSIGDSSSLLGVPGTCLLFQPEHLEKYIVEASGLEPVDTFVGEVTPATRDTHRSLEAMLNGMTNGVAAHGLKGLQEEDQSWGAPCIALDWDGATFVSVHLALRKPETGSRVNNAWARPTPPVEQAIQREYSRVIEGYDGWAPPVSMPPVPVDRADIAVAQRARAATKAHLHVGATIAAELDGLRSEVERHAAAVVKAAPAGSPREAWTPIRVTRSNVPPFTIFVDRTNRRDIIGRCYLEGLANVVNAVEFELMRCLVKPGDPIIDAGAHIGSIALPFGAAGHPVLAIEAAPANAAMLRASAAYNGFRNVTVVHAAVAAEEGQLGFLSDGAWGWLTNSSELPSEVVPAVTLDAMVEGLGWDRVALLKLDIEGAELAAIHGASRLLSRPDAPALYYESNKHTHEHAGTRVDQVIATLEAFGYRSYAIAPGRLTRVYPDEAQAELLRDHIAVKGSLPVVAGLSIRERRG